MLWILRRCQDGIVGVVTEAWTRIEARRAFMQNALGIQVQDEVLPLSDLCGYLPPYLFSPRRAMRKAR